MRLKVRLPNAQRLVNLIDEQHSDADGRGAHEVALDGYGYRWFRAGTLDDTLIRAPY